MDECLRAWENMGNRACLGCFSNYFRRDGTKRYLETMSPVWNVYLMAQIAEASDSRVRVIQAEGKIATSF